MYLVIIGVEVQDHNSTGNFLHTLEMLIQILHNHTFSFNFFLLSLHKFSNTVMWCKVWYFIIRFSSNTCTVYAVCTVHCLHCLPLSCTSSDTLVSPGNSFSTSPFAFSYLLHICFFFKNKTRYFTKFSLLIMWWNNPLRQLTWACLVCMT